jgi:hypothetical protein
MLGYMLREPPEQILSWAVGLAEEGWEEPRLARLLEECELTVWEERDEMLALVHELHAEYFPLTCAALRVPGDLYAEALREEGSIGGAIDEALSGELACFQLEAGPPRSWSNQGASFDRSDAPRVWKGMRFRSYSEQCIAEALDRACIDFEPNCLIRTGPTPDDRLTVEPDFIVYAHGRIGVLEVDGAPWHPPERADEHHARDRRFRLKGWIVERFDSEECRNFPDDVVAQFLAVLRAPP